MIGSVELILSEPVLQILYLPLEHVVLLQGAVLSHGLRLIPLFSLDSFGEVGEDLENLIRG